MASSSTPIFQPLSTRTQSFSSLSSLSSTTSSFGSSFLNQDDDYFSSPRTPFRISGIPFSWEQIPGIPKQKSSKKNDPSQSSLLPLPPSGNYSSSLKKYKEEISPKKSSSDPFFTALIECSKDDQEGSKVTRTLSDRFRIINMYTSCKRACSVSDSVVYLPRSRTYNVLRRRSS